MSLKNFIISAIALFILLNVIIFLYYSPNGKSRRAVADNNLENNGNTNGKVLVFCSDPWPPYANNVNDIEEGYLVELVRNIYEPLGYRVIYVNKPWARCIEETRNGIVDSVLGASPAEAPGLVYPKIDAAKQRAAFFTLKDSVWLYKDISSLKKIRLGVIKDYIYDKKIFAYIKSIEGSHALYETTGNEALRRLLEALFQKRIDAFVENEKVLQYTLKKMGLKRDTVRFAGFASEEDPLCVPFSPKRKDAAVLAKQFDDGFTRLMKEGKLKKIMKKYGISEDEISK